MTDEHTAVGADESGPRKISRRKVVVGAAWAVPVIMVATASPAAAVTLPPCVQDVTDTATGWIVEDAQYPGCSSPCHRDVVLAFTVKCEGKVDVKVQPISGRAMWCINGDTTAVTKQANGAGTVLTFPVPGDVISGSCTMTDHYNGTPAPGNCDTYWLQNCGPGFSWPQHCVNDGIHVNPCGSGAHINYYIRTYTGSTPNAWQGPFGWTASGVTCVTCPR